MADDLPDEDAARAAAEDYASENCVGTVGEVEDVRREEDIWIVDVRTHTYADEHLHRLRITARVGNVISHDRDDRID